MKNYNKTSLFLASFLFLSSIQANEQALAMTDIGTLGGVYSSVYNVSTDGSVIVGESGDGTNNRAFVYRNGVMTDLGTLGGLTSYASGISADNSIIVGGAANAGGFSHAFKYTDSGGMFDLGTLGGTDSFANDISADGSFIVGGSLTVGGSVHAFKYAVTGATTGIMIDIGTLSGGSAFSYANAISADGVVTVGGSSDGVNFHAFRHTDLGGMVDLGTFGGTNSSANDVSDDGSIIVGNANNSGGNNRAFKYTVTGATTGTMVDLGTFGGLISNANGISGNGLVIVGDADDALGNARAFKYTDTDGMIDIGTLGGLTSTAWGVSANGSIIVGDSTTALGDTHAFIYQNTIVDINNTAEALYYNSAELNSVMNLKSALVNYSLNQDCDQFGKNGLCLGLGARHSEINKHNTSEQAANLRLAYKITPKIKAGFIIDQTFNSNDPANFSVSSSTPMTSVFANVSENNDGSGFNFRIAGSYNKSKTQIKRNVLDYTEVGKGDTDLESTGLLAQISYKKSFTKKAELTPYIGIRQTTVTRDGYTENVGASFPITYDSVQSKSTTTIAGLLSSFKITSNLGVEFGAGIEHDISNKTDNYKATIPYVGSVELEGSKMANNRAFGTVGSFYQFANDKKISTGVYYGKQPLNNSNAATVYVNYSIGL